MKMNKKYFALIISVIILTSCLFYFFIMDITPNNINKLKSFTFNSGRNVTDEIASDWQQDSVLVGAYTIELKQNVSYSFHSEISFQPDSNFTDGNTSTWVYNYVSELTNLKLIIILYGNGTFITHETIREGTGQQQKISNVIDSNDGIIVAMQQNGSSVLETNNISYISYSLSYYYDTPCWIIGYLTSDDLCVYQIIINAIDGSVLVEAE